jgi:hypothetical protein
VEPTNFVLCKFYLPLYCRVHDCEAQSYALIEEQIYGVEDRQQDEYFKKNGISNRSEEKTG